MKVSIGMKLQAGSWGGGNQFGKALTQFLQDRGESVCHDLTDSNLDIILLAEPDVKLRISAYGHRDILRYLLLKNRRAIVIHRINNTSEARNDSKKDFNNFRLFANQIADHTTFVSQWVKDRYVESGFDASRPNSIILNGSDSRLWKPGPATPRGTKLRLITHHWSNHWNKGFAVYKKLDEMLADPFWSSRIDFTYVGRLPEGFRFQYARFIEPLSGEALAETLRSHDVYLTGSMFESGGHHNLEGALCGLPILFLGSGSMPEYCQGFGLEFTMETFADTLEEMINDWEKWHSRMPQFPHTAERMCERYYALFQELHGQRNEILARRNWLRRLPWIWTTMFGQR